MFFCALRTCELIVMFVIIITEEQPCQVITEPLSNIYNIMKGLIA